MLFNSFEYVLFLWAVFVVFWSLAKQRPLRHALLLIASYWFYSRADWRFCGLLVLSSVVDFTAGAQVAAALDAGSKARARLWMILSLVVNLGILGFFKYANFFFEGFADLAGAVGLNAAQLHLDVVLPVGISFYTFQTLSYTLDIYRGKLKPIRSLLDFSLYVSFFPQLVAGPIVRAVDFLPQLEAPPVRDDRRISSGLFQILRGMAKKLLMADVLGAQIVDLAFRDAGSLAELSGPGLLLVTWAYALQLYGDFAGYSDIAIGSARLLGFELPKNFDAPYKSKNLESFWSRWHISMSSWFMDYVYIGLGGSRVGELRYARNVIVAWGLVGLWHGASWTFVLWGLYHAGALVLLRWIRKLLPGGGLPKGLVWDALGMLLTFHVVALSMILFRCRDMDMFWTAMGRFTTLSGELPVISGAVAVVMVIGYASHLMPESFQEGLERGWDRLPGTLQGAALAIAMLAFFALHPPGAEPFIYFQF